MRLRHGRQKDWHHPNGRTSALRTFHQVLNDPQLTSRSRCQRWHPLVCVNQALLMELKWIRDHHRLASDERRSATYAKAMASIKAYPYAIKTAKEALNILGVGDKIAAQCGEYAKSGKIHAAGMSPARLHGSKLIRNGSEEIKRDKRHVTMIEFSKIHGVGATTARELYDKYNCRTLADVEAIGQLLPSMGERSTQRKSPFRSASMNHS